MYDALRRHLNSLPSLKENRDLTQGTYIIVLVFSCGTKHNCSYFNSLIKFITVKQSRTGSWRSACEFPSSNSNIYSLLKPFQYNMELNIS